MKYLSLVQLFALLSVVLGSPIDSRSVDCTTDEQLARAKASRDGQVSANKEQVAAVAYAPMVEVTSSVPSLILPPFFSFKGADGLLRC